MKLKETSPAYRTRKKPFTYQDYIELPEDGKRYEVIDGELIMVPAPYTIHQKVSANIIDELRPFTKKVNLGEVLYAPIDVVLSETNVLQPDILFVSNENAHIIAEKNITGAPDLVIEILSPSTGYYDLIAKKEIYEKYDIKEYWIVDPNKQWVEVYVNQDRKFNLIQRLQEKGVLSSQILNGFQIHVEKIFSLE